jgi:transcription antitermination factor NusG
MTDGASEYFVLFHHKVIVACAVEVRHRKPGTAQDKPKGRTLCLLSCPTGRQRALWIYRERSSVGNANVVLGAKLRVGQVVRVLAGPFVGVLGVLERLDGKGRVRLLLNIMGGQTPLMVDRADLAAA